MGCCKSLCGNLFKLILILINIPLLLIGIAMIVFGSMTAFAFSTLVSWFTDLGDYAKVITDVLTYLDEYAVGVGIAMLVLGIFISIVAFLGGCGVCCKNYCMLVTYSVLVGIVAVGSLIAAIIFLVDSSILVDPIADEFLTTIENSYDDLDNPALKGDYKRIDGKMLAYASLFRLFECCGVNSYTDFQKANKTWNRIYDYGNNVKAVAAVPVMCCKSEYKYLVGDKDDVWPYTHPGKNQKLDPACIANPTKENAYIEDSCIEVLTGGSSSVLAWIVFGLAFAMLIIFFIAVVVTVMDKKKSGSSDYEMNYR